MIDTTTTPPVTEKFGNTEEFATLNRVKGTTVRVRYCNTGSYFGVRPTKLANGRLDWPLIRVEAKK